MDRMAALRRSRRLATLLLAWFALWLGATLASPMVGDSGLHLVCAGNAFKLVSGDPQAPAALSGHLGQCPACVQGSAPPPAAFALLLPSAPALSAPPAFVDPPLPADAAAPPGARGPPRFS